MKIQTRQRCRLLSSLVHASLSSVLVLAVAGCATSTYKQGDSAAVSLQNAADEVQIESHELNTTMACLNDLVNKPAPDLKPQFHEFSKAVDRLQGAVARNERAGQKVVERHTVYLESWDQQLTNMNYEAVRTQSEGRRTQVATRFDNVNRRYAEARTAMRPLLDYLNDIRRALATDLTRDGLQAVRPIVANGADNAGKVQIALANLKSELTSSGVRMSSYTLQPAAPIADNPQTETLAPTGPPPPNQTNQ